MLSFWRRSSQFQKILVILTVYGFFYVGLALSPSSYSTVLEKLGVNDTGLYFGKPRLERSDEWAVLTPFLQISVNNNFERYNKTSPYNEDLRSFHGLPTHDWAIIFKPNLWGFAILPPAYAYSFYFFSLTALFILGYTLFFQRLGLKLTDSLCFTLIFYFSATTQYWWTIGAPLICYIPLAYLLLSGNGALWKRSLVLFYLTTAAMLTYFYAVAFPAIALIIIVLLLATGHRFRILPFLTFSVAVATATAVSVLYLWDSVKPMLDSVYPAKRSFGGGEIPFSLWLTHFLPTAKVHDGISLMLAEMNNDERNFNVCEIATFGSHLLLIMLIFGDWKTYRANLHPEQKRFIAYAAGTILCIWCWMLFPVPSGIPILEHIRPRRWQIPAGVLIIALAALILTQLNFNFNWKRFTLFATLVLAGNYFLKNSPHDIPLYQTYEDWVIILPVLLIVLMRGKIFIEQQKLFILLSVVASHMLAYATYNPVQSAEPIFNRKETLKDKFIKLPDNANAEGFIVQSFFDGAVMNGLGYRSIPHVQLKPELTFFRKYFPDMPEKEFLETFNRYGFISVQDVDAPYAVPPDLIIVPFDAFGKTQSRRQVRLEENIKDLCTIRTSGQLDSITPDPNQPEIVTLRGWAPWHDINTSQSLRINTGSTVLSASIQPELRTDLAENMLDSSNAFSGFNVTLTLPKGATLDSKALCIESEDPVLGKFLIRGADKCGQNKPYEELRSIEVNDPELADICSISKAGRVELYEETSKEFLIHGWAAWQSIKRGQTIQLMTPSSLKDVSITSDVRTDVRSPNEDASEFRGFTLSIPKQANPSLRLDAVKQLCIASSDTHGSHHIITRDGECSFMPFSKSERRVRIFDTYGDMCNYRFAGNVDAFEVTERSIKASGWAEFKGISGNQIIQVTSTLPFRSFEISPEIRPDLHKELQFSGFSLKLFPYVGALHRLASEAISTLCIAIDDPEQGMHYLKGLPGCKLPEIKAPALRTFKFFDAYGDQCSLRTSGHVDKILHRGDITTISGWGNWSSVSAVSSLNAVGKIAPLSTTFNPVLRPDLAKNSSSVLERNDKIFSGFEAILQYPENTPTEEREPCLISNDPSSGNYILNAGGGCATSIPVPKPQRQIAVSGIYADICSFKRMGIIESINQVSSNSILISGWGNWKGLTPNQSLSVITEKTIKSVMLEEIVRPDLLSAFPDNDLEFSGFIANVTFEENIDVAEETNDLCLVSHDPINGSHMLEGSGDCYMHPGSTVDTRELLTKTVHTADICSVREGGTIESVKINGNNIQISGWAHFSNNSREKSLMLLSNDTLDNLHFSYTMREQTDVSTRSRIDFSGFIIDGEIKKSSEEPFELCILSEDSNEGSYVLKGGSNCPAVMKPERDRQTVVRDYPDICSLASSENIKTTVIDGKSLLLSGALPFTDYSSKQLIQVASASLPILDAEVYSDLGISKNNATNFSGFNLSLDYASEVSKHDVSDLCLVASDPHEGSQIIFGKNACPGILIPALPKSAERKIHIHDYPDICTIKKAGALENITKENHNIQIVGDTGFASIKAGQSLNISSSEVLKNATHQLRIGTNSFSGFSIQLETPNFRQDDACIIADDPDVGQSIINNGKSCRILPMDIAAFADRKIQLTDIKHIETRIEKEKTFGNIDLVEAMSPIHLKITGWADWKGYKPDQELFVVGKNITSTRMDLALRSDLKKSEFAFSGFVLFVEYSSETAVADKPCILSRDGSKLLKLLGNQPHCEHLRAKKVPEILVEAPSPAPPTPKIPSTRKAIQIASLAKEHLPKTGGVIDTVEYKDGKAIITGWAKWSGTSSNQKLWLSSKQHFEQFELEDIARPDVAKSQKNPAMDKAGFRLTITAKEPVTETSGLALCIISEDPELGSYILENQISCQPEQLTKRNVAIAKDEEVLRNRLQNGVIDSVVTKGRTLIVSGWAWFEGVNEKQLLTVFTEGATSVVSHKITPRFDVAHSQKNPSLTYSGFELLLKLKSTPKNEAVKVCIISEDPKLGIFILASKQCDIAPRQSLAPESPSELFKLFEEQHP